MSDFYKLRKGLKYTGNKPNIDYRYGPYETLEEALAAIENKVVGLTIGIYVDSSKKKVKEKWFQKNLNGDLELVDKIEEYELVLKLFDLEIENDRIKITYKIGGKGLNTKVSISGTSVLSQSVTFDKEEVTYVDVSIPKVYYYRISVKDALGTSFNNNGIPVEKSISWGDIIAKATRTKALDYLLPLLSLYENKPLGISVEYNTEKVKNVEIWMYGKNDGDLNESQSYPFEEIVDNNGKINTTILLPKNDNIHNYYKNKNIIYAVYSEAENLNTRITKEIYSFNILNPGQFALKFPNGIPEIGYAGAALSLDVSVLYGGDIEGLEPIRLKQIEITLDNLKPATDDINVNSTKNITYILDVEIPDNELEITKTLKIKLTDNIYKELQITIRKITKPQTPYGENIYFNSEYNVDPYKNYYGTFLDPRTNAPLLPTKGNKIIWSSDELLQVLEITEPHFNLDLNIITSLSGSDDPLVVIKRGNDNLLTIGRLKITSEYMFDKDGKSYQKNGLVLPQNNECVHIGFGYQRVLGSDSDAVFYNCIFINGEVAFCSETQDVYNKENNSSNLSLSSVTISFNNVFNINEFSLSVGNRINDVKNCVDSGGNTIDTYVLTSGQYDVFYYNWLTTLPVDYLFKQYDNLMELLLIPFMEPLNSSESSWWTALRSRLETFGSNIKATDKKRNYIFEFVKFGEINHGNKAGIETIPKRLFEFRKTDKEDSKLDKVRGVICKYRFVEGESISYDENKYCIVQVQGTSTLAYPVPNFLFTFIKYVNGDFLLDDSVTLDYTTPILGNILNSQDIEFTQASQLEAQIEGETNLVAKADSMDSSHLNNTPTCIYFNSLVDALNNNSDENYFNNFHKFDSNYLDAIVGSPILLKIDSRDGSGTDENTSVDDSINYKSYGTFMFNIGKSAANMGLNDSLNEIFSLEGLSNESVEGALAGLFSYPSEGNVYEAFNKLVLTCENNEVTLDDSNLSNQDKKLVIEYLINSDAFESRSTIDDDDIIDINNHWNDYALPILRMWLFINRATGSVAGTDFYDYFDKVFNKDYAILYYINLVLFGQADNLGKNMMIDAKPHTTNGNHDEVWYIRPYDLDSEFGLTNNGYDDFPVYACISENHFEERYGRPYDGGILPSDTFNKYNSASSNLWIKFWAAFKDEIITYYRKLRETYVTPERIINIGENLVSNFISKEQYNIDFSLKHLGTKFSYLNKGGRFLNYEDWITKRFMYVDSYFSYFSTMYNEPGYNGYTWTIEKTLVPIFYEANYLSSKTRYGYEDFTYESPLNSNMQYVFSVVPEAILSMSPIWGNIKSDVRSGKFKNLLIYSGEYEDSIFRENNGLNLKEIEILIPGNRVTISSPLTIPSSVRILKLEKLNTAEDGQALLNIDTNASGLEELYIHNCNIGNLNLENLPLLKKLHITSDTSNDNTVIKNLTLNNLLLSELKIDYNTYINSFNITGTITSNDVIDLSGLHCGELTFTRPTVKELYLDLLYDFNGLACSGYKFAENNIVVSSYSTLHENLRNSNIKIDNEYVYFNNTNFRRISPNVGNIKLDLSNCTNLETLSCIGFTEIEELVIPTTVKNLNLQFCKNLKRINCGDSIENFFNFEGFSGLKCKSNYVFIRLCYYWHSDPYPSDYRYYDASPLLQMLSFNLMGCDSVTKIKNLNSSNLPNFTGNYFVSGCRNLGNDNNEEPSGRGFENCTLSFTNLLFSFRMTESLVEIPDTFTFNELTLSSSTEGAFADSSVSIYSIMQTLSTLKINANNMFVASLIKENIGTENEPLVLNWISCNSTFGARNYNPNMITNNLLDYEYFCITNSSYGKNAFSSSVIRNIYIKLPYATSVYRMFVGQYIKILNPDTIFLGNTVLTNANGFVARTKQETLINFANCTHLTNVGFCYSESRINKNNIIPGCKLPANTSSNIYVYGMFKGVDLTGFNAENVFLNITTNDANGCFENTGCNCFGSPFGSISNSKAIDISSMFGTRFNWKTGVYNYGIGTISNLSWITDGMYTSNRSRGQVDDLRTLSYSGVFEGKIISTLGVIKGDRRSLEKMFKNCIINDSTGTFLINGENSSSIFESASLPQEDISNRLTITINNNVINLNKAFLNLTLGYIDIDISNNNVILDTSYCFSRSKGDIVILNKGNNYIYFPRLYNAAHMFDNRLMSGLQNDTGGNINIGTIPSGLFKGSASLANLDYFFAGLNVNCVFDFSDCVNIKSMDYSFYNSGILTIPTLPLNMPQLTSIKGTFRRIKIVDEDTIVINAQSLSNAQETFAESRSVNKQAANKNITVNITSNSLYKIDAFSTNEYIDVNITNLYSNMSALLAASISNVTVEGNNSAPKLGGDLGITGAGETGKFITYTDGGWNSITTERHPSPTNSNYSLATVTYFG